MADPPTQSELLFANYLLAHGYVGERNFDWRERYGVSTRKNPDFLVCRAQEELAICEVKEFTTTKINQRLDSSPQYSSSSGAELYGEAADAIQSAALEQLRPFSGVGLPLVAVLANPHNQYVALGPDGLTYSMFGTTDAVQIPVGPDGPAGDARLVALGAGALRAGDGSGAVYNPHPSLSAVVVVHARTNAQDFIDAELARRRPAKPLTTRQERSHHIITNAEALAAADREGRIPGGEYEWVEVFDLRGDYWFTGVPLPPNVFDGPRDRWYLVGPHGRFVERG